MKKVAETRKENNFYSRVCNKRIESARVFPHMGEKGEFFSAFIQGVSLKPFMKKIEKRA